jgi:hypothetical protein
MKKEDLKTGMIAETLDGLFRVVWGNALVSAEDEGARLSDYTDDLIRISTYYSQTTVVKIYSEPKQAHGGGFKTLLRDGYIIKKSTLLWERPKEEKIILTLDGVDYSEATLRSLIQKATK